MSEMIFPRRKFLMGMAGLLAAPAIVRIESLMPVAVFRQSNFLTIDQITRQMVKLFADTNLILQNIDAQYEYNVRMSNIYMRLP